MGAKRGMAHHLSLTPESRDNSHWAYSRVEYTNGLC